MGKSGKAKSKVERVDRTVWSTGFVFLTMIILTALMILGVKAMVTGSVRSVERVDIRATK